jgi:ribosomal-protein-alanine N-acetyltransferase
MPTIELKPATRSDADPLIRANLESRAHHAPWSKPFTDHAGFEDWFGGLVTGANIGLVARERGAHAVIGVLHLSQICRGNFQSAYLGFYGMASSGGRGLMTEAVRRTAIFAFNEIGLHRIEANIQPANLKSVALVRRVGFQKEGFAPRYLRIDGEWRDHERWALLADMLPHQTE